MSLVRTMYAFGDEMGRKVGGGWEVQILEVGSIHVRTCAAAPRVPHKSVKTVSCFLFRKLVGPPRANVVNLLACWSSGYQNKALCKETYVN